MEFSGIEYSIDYLIREIEKELIFMDNSEGGVTFSGGEPLLFPDTLLELLLRCKAIGVHRAVETSLHAKEEIVAAVMRVTDLFLVDLKLMDSVKHKHFCGVPNELILSNLRMIAEDGKEFIVRIPLIEGINTDEENITHSAEFLVSLPWERKAVTLLPYHEVAKGKHEKLGIAFNPENIPLSTPSLEKQQRCIKIFSQFGIIATIGG
jgi:pyruvate formate lyase activating enzyme